VVAGSWQQSLGLFVVMPLPHAQSQRVLARAQRVGRKLAAPEESGAPASPVPSSACTSSWLRTRAPVGMLVTGGMLQSLLAGRAGSLGATLGVVSVSLLAPLVANHVQGKEGAILPWVPSGRLPPSGALLPSRPLRLECWSWAPRGLHAVDEEGGLVSASWLPARPRP